MRVITLVGIAIMLVVVPIRPSSAQNSQNMGCLTRIYNCLNVADDIIGCCPTFKEEIENERECFCMVMDRLQQKDASTASALEVYLFQCGIIGSLKTICSGTTSSSPTQPSSPSNSTSSSPPTPSTTSPRSPSLTPTEKSIAPPPSESTNCWKRIATCMETTTVPSEAVKCCPVIEEEITNERECFCVAKTTISENPSAARGFSKLFAMCGIPGSFDTLCPDGPPLSSTRTTPMTLPPPASTDTNNNASNATSTESTSASLGVSTTKFAYSVGLILPSSFLITGIILGYV